MSPEQLQGRDLTLKVDVWAVGVIMWELLNEEIPWSDRRNCNDRKALAKHVAVGGARLRKTPNNKLTRDETARSTVHDIMEAAFQASTDKRPSMSKMHQRLRTMTDAHEHVALELEAYQQRLESQLRSFYAKHNPTKIAEVPDLASLFQGRPHDVSSKWRGSVVFRFGSEEQHC
jgi:serine/threonine protein kinase